MNKHEFLPPNTHGASYCKHCGAKKLPGSLQTCFNRPGDAATDRPPRVMAIYDIDTIHSRLAELELARKEALNTVDEGTP